MILLIDNYDSFTYNLVHCLGELGARMRVVRNDRISVEEAIESQPDSIVISPGPGTPRDAGITLDLVRRAGRAIPVLGVCLGHQAIAAAYGGAIVRAPRQMHGKTSRIHHHGEGVFRGLPDGFQATRYHSLIVDRGTLPEDLVITAETEDGIIMGISHREHPVHGVQFHPESIASEHGHKLLQNFLELADKA